jgi:hypothetical protein
MLLGSSDSGKTTVLKQLKIIHGGGYSMEERKKFHRYIHMNVLETIRLLVENMKEMNIPLENESNEVIFCIF